MSSEEFRLSIRGAAIGAAAGLVIGLCLWWLNGLFIGLANDYQMYRRYDAEASLVRKIAIAVPLCAALGAFIGFKIGTRRPR